MGKSGKGGFKGGNNGRAGKSRGKGNKVNINLRVEKGGIGIKGLL